MPVISLFNWHDSDAGALLRHFGRARGVKALAVVMAAAYPAGMSQAPTSTTTACMFSVEGVFSSPGPESLLVPGSSATSTSMLRVHPQRQRWRSSGSACGFTGVAIQWHGGTIFAHWQDRDSSAKCVLFE